MTIQSNNIIKGSDFTNAGNNIIEKLNEYEVRRQALSVDSVFWNYTPDPIQNPPVAVVYNKQETFNFLPVQLKPEKNALIDEKYIKQYTNAIKVFNNKLKTELHHNDQTGQITNSDIIHNGEILDNYENTTVAVENFNNLTTILTRAYNILTSSDLDYYTDYEIGNGTCKRSCQVQCQATCQNSCQGYSSCHNQKCGTH